jgi:hypothetical protein
VAIAIPAASSREELMRLPVDSCSIATDKGRSFTCRDALAIKALIFVLMTGIKVYLGEYCNLFIKEAIKVPSQDNQTLISVMKNYKNTYDGLTLVCCIGKY